MNIGELKQAIADLPDEMEVIGECGSGQEKVDEVSLCLWEHDGWYYDDEERGEMEHPKIVTRATDPVLKVVVHY